MRGQYTLKESIEWSGRTLHTGLMSSVRVAPAAAGFGIKFKRTDLDIDKWISADTRYVTSTDRSTNVGSGEVEIATVEHLLAAFRGVGIDCAEVYVDGPEIPILDGSSSQFYEDMLPLKHSLEATSTKVWSPREVISYEHAETGARFTLLPAEKFSCEVVLTFDHKDIGERYAQYTESDDFGQVASSRTFVFSNELVGLAKKGLIKGGSLENAIVIPSPETGEQELREALQMLGMNDIDNTVERVSDGFALRSKNELARHKLLDLIGDLVLVGCRINGRIMAEKPGHTANVAFAKHLRALHQKSLKLKGKPVYDPTADPIYDIEAVRGFLPHRYPFLLVDKIIELTDTHVVGVKNVTINEGLFQGHFPGNAVFPGVLQMEALAQTGGILALSTVDNPADWDTYFLKMDSVKFKRKVLPGDTLILKMELLNPIRRGIVHMQGTAYVGDHIVSEGELTAQIVNRNA